ncbi:MAG: TonB-dependent receptor [Terriglobales bacterium]
MLRRLACFSALLAAFALPLTAQTLDTATIRGVVTDPSGAAVPAAVVVASNGQTGARYTGLTSAHGRFRLADLPIAGVYTLTAAHTGFATATATGLRLSAGQTAMLTLKLNLAGQTAQVTVTGALGTVNAREPQLGVSLGPRQLADTPLPNRRLTSVALLNSANRPAINQGDVFMNQSLFTTNGAGRRQTSFEVDDSTGNDSWGRQTIFTNVPLAAIQEMTVLTNAFSAQYGATMGGAVNIVTQSGGEAWHGSLLETWRPAGTEGTLPGLTELSNGGNAATDTLWQTAWDLSGPLARHTQLALAGEVSYEDRGSLVTSPAAPGVFTGQYRDGMEYARLDHQYSATHSGFLRLDVDSFYDTNPNDAVGGFSLPSADRIFKRRTYTAQAGDDLSLGADFVNALRLQFQLASPITSFSPVDFGTEYVIRNVLTSGSSQSALLLNRQYELTDTVGVDTGRHQINFGADAIVAHNGGDSKEYGGPITQGEFVFNPCPAGLTPTYCATPAYMNLGNVQSYTQSFGSAQYTVTDTLWSTFVQDHYQLLPNLTADVGLRYEQQTFSNARDDFAPRLGFAYDWHGTVVRGGYGIYYGQLPDNLDASYAIGGPQGAFNYTAFPGGVGFPTSLTAVPLPAFPAGAVLPPRSIYVRAGDSAYLDSFFPTSLLPLYPSALLNPYSEQWTLGVQRAVAPGWVLSVDYLGSHSVHVDRELDIDPPSPFLRTAPGQVRSPGAANCTRPYWAWWYQQQGVACMATPPLGYPEPPYSVIDTDTNDGYGAYDALEANVSHRFRSGFSLLASYTWSHALDNVDPDIPGQAPNLDQFTGPAEYGDAIFDQRHRFVLSGIWSGPWAVQAGGVVTLASGLPYNITTGADNSGDGQTSDRPVINGAVIGRNAGRGTPIYDADLFLQRAMALTPRWHLNLRLESFNLLNHANVVGFNGVYGDGATAAPGFGEPLTGVTNVLPPRELQFLAKLSF